MKKVTIEWSPDGKFKVESNCSNTIETLGVLEFAKESLLRMPAEQKPNNDLADHGTADRG